MLTEKRVVSLSKDKFTGFKAHIHLCLKEHPAHILIRRSDLLNALTSTRFVVCLFPQATLYQNLTKALGIPVSLPFCAFRRKEWSYLWPKGRKQVMRKKYRPSCFVLSITVTIRWHVISSGYRIPKYIRGFKNTENRESRA